MLLHTIIWPAAVSLYLPPLESTTFTSTVMDTHAPRAPSQTAPANSRSTQVCARLQHDGRHAKAVAAC